MALNGIVDVSYIIDILYYTVIDDGWGIGKVNCNNYLKSDSDFKIDGSGMSAYFGNGRVNAFRAVTE